MLIAMLSRSVLASEATTSNWKDEAYENFKSPLTTDAKYPLFVGAAITGGLLLFRDQIVDPFQKMTAEEKILGEHSKRGDWAGKGFPNLIYVAGMLTHGLMTWEDSSFQNASSMLQASLYSTLVTSALKVTVQEKRPYDPDVRNSFPSGHTTSAFAFASYIGCRHSRGWGIAAYSLATFVGYSRINDNAHYIHDVVAGAAIGASYGLGICIRENEKRNGVSPSKDHAPVQSSVRSDWNLLPVEGGLGGLITIQY